jgi:oxygen-independent coproporphyrinogen-3 oxidase
MVDRESWPVTFETLADDRKLAALHSPHLYVHLPSCERLCHYCPYAKFLRDGMRERSCARSLLDEIGAFMANGPIEPIVSLCFGGGSPSLSLTLVERIVDHLRPHFADGVEVAIELHPAHCDATRFDRLTGFGITKVSIGAELFSQSVLATLDPPYSPEQARSAVATAKERGFDCVDVNLIYGISRQAIETVLSDVRMAICLEVDHISAYPLFAFRPGRQGKTSRLQPKGIRAIGDLVAIQKRVSALCSQQGYVRASVWSFTRPGIGPHTTVTCESYRGFGIGAASRLKDRFWFNTFSLEHYVAAPTRPALAMRSTPRLQRFHWLYWQIYKTEIDPGRYHELYGRGLERDFRCSLLAMRLPGWLERPDDRLRVTERGAVLAHLLQSLFSLSYIDILWSRCQSEPAAL